MSLLFYAVKASEGLELLDELCNFNNKEFLSRCTRTTISHAFVAPSLDDLLIDRAFIPQGINLFLRFVRKIAREHVTEVHIIALRTNASN